MLLLAASRVRKTVSGQVESHAAVRIEIHSTQNFNVCKHLMKRGVWRSGMKLEHISLLSTLFH